MEQLQRLAETIADTYIRDRIREHGNIKFTHGGKTGEISRELLSSSLLDNCVYRTAVDRWSIQVFGKPLEQVAEEIAEAEGF